MSFPPGNLPKCKTGPSFVPSTSALLSELCPQGTLVAQLNLSLPFLETHRVGSMLLTSSLALALAGAQLTVPLLNLQVCEWQPPEQLKQLLDLELRDTGEPHNRLLELCQDVIRYSVKTSKNFNLPPGSVLLTCSYIFLGMYLSHSKTEYDHVYEMRIINQK